PHHLLYFRDWRRTRRCRRHDVSALLRPGRFLHGLCRGHQGVYRRRARRHRLAARRDARRGRGRAERDAVVGPFLGRIQGRRRLLDPDRCLDFPPHWPARPARSRKSLVAGESVTISAPEVKPAARVPGIPFILKKALLSAFVAFVLFSLMVGIRTEAGPTGQLTYWTRFGELASLVGAVFAGSIVIELLRQWLGPADTRELIPQSVQNGLAVAGRFVAPALLIFTLLVPVI